VRILEGLFFLIACVGMVLIIIWTLKNDQAGPQDETTGLFAMKEPPAIPEGRNGGRRRAAPRVRPPAPAD
jgi:hypothetical protein